MLQIHHSLCGTLKEYGWHRASRIDFSYSQKKNKTQRIREFSEWTKGKENTQQDGCSFFSVHYQSSNFPSHFWPVPDHQDGMPWAKDCCHDLLDIIPITGQSCLTCKEYLPPMLWPVTRFVPSPNSLYIFDMAHLSLLHTKIIWIYSDFFFCFQPFRNSFYSFRTCCVNIVLTN